MIGGLSPMELAVVAAIVMLFFGARRLPELGRSLGSGIKEFKKGLAGEDETKALAKDEASSDAPKPPA